MFMNDLVLDEENGELWVHMKGACENCASSTVTLRFKVLGAMKMYCPEVISVQRRDIDDQDD